MRLYGLGLDRKGRLCIRNGGNDYSLHNQEDIEELINILNEKSTVIADMGTNIIKKNKYIGELEFSVKYWKEKYYNSQSQVIDEYSDNVQEDMDKLHNEVYGCSE